MASLAIGNLWKLLETNSKRKKQREEEVFSFLYFLLIANRQSLIALYIIPLFGCKVKRILEISSDTSETCWKIVKTMERVERHGVHEN